jgi:hypothetical protein
MRLYRYEGTDPERHVSDWIRETDEYRNMMAASGRWFADTIDEALWYRCEHESGVLMSVEIEDDEAELWRVSNLQQLPGGRSRPENPAAWSLRPEREFFLPRDLAILAVPFNEDPALECEAAAQLSPDGRHFQLGALPDLLVRCL